MKRHFKNEKTGGKPPPDKILCVVSKSQTHTLIITNPKKRSDKNVRLTINREIYLRKVTSDLLGLTGLLDLAKTSHGGTASDGRRGGEGPGATRHGLAAGLTLALPDADSQTLHGVLAAELASVPIEQF